MLAPRPPAGRPTKGEDVTHEVQLLLEAVQGESIDWEKVREVVGERVDVPDSWGEDISGVIEGAQVMKGVDEGEVLATFYDQQDAMDMLREKQQNAPEEFQEYWCKGVEMQLSEINKKSRVFKREQQRAARVQRENNLVTDDIKQLVAAKQSKEEYQKLLDTLKRVREGIETLNTGITEQEDVLWRVKQGPDPRLKVGTRAALRAKLEENINKARGEEQEAAQRIDDEAAVESFILGEVVSRRALESEYSTSYIHLSWEGILSTERARFKEECTAQRSAIADEFTLSCEAQLLPLFVHFQQRAERQNRIAELKTLVSR